MKHDPKTWAANYQRDGYLVVEDAIDPQTLAGLREAMEKISTGYETLPANLRRHVQLERDYSKSKPQYNDLSAEQIGNAVRNIMETPLFDKRLADVIMYAPILDVLETLFASSEFHFHNYKCITKAPKVSSVFRWHRDLPYLEHSTANLITCMICLDPMTAENGATVVLPGTHRVPHDQVTSKDMDIPEGNLPKDAEHVMVCCPAGSIVLFHVNIVHGGPANRSDIPRRNLISIWAGPDTYPVTPGRFVYQDLYPRSKNPGRQRQVQMTFPHLFGMPGKEHSDVGGRAYATAAS